jgi:Cu-Zn family superoxide dismutase
MLRLTLKNATPGVHALHIHEIGRCEAPSFESAGGHVAPAGGEHGFYDGAGPHAGDLPNIYVPASTELTVEYHVDNLTLASGPRSLLDANGSSVVIHAGRDDYISDPAGRAGDRLACGVIALTGEHTIPHDRGSAK